MTTVISLSYNTGEKVKVNNKVLFSILFPRHLSIHQLWPFLQNRTRHGKLHVVFAIIVKQTQF